MLNTLKNLLSKVDPRDWSWKNWLAVVLLGGCLWWAHDSGQTDVVVNALESVVGAEEAADTD